MRQEKIKNNIEEALRFTCLTSQIFSRYRLAHHQSMPLNCLLVTSQRSGHRTCKSLKEPTLFEGSTMFFLEPIRDPSKRVNEGSLHPELPAGPVLWGKIRKPSPRMYRIYSRPHRSPNFILGFLCTTVLQYFHQKT